MPPEMGLHPGSLGLHMIVKDDSAEELDRALDSVYQYMDQIVIVQTGPKQNSVTPQMLSKYKPEVYRFDWIDDFAAARNHALQYMRTDWITWMDADDVIEDASKFRTLIDSLPEEKGAVWLPYVYSVDEYGNPTTLHDKERLLKRSVGWKWEGMVHEVVVPQSQCFFHREDEPVWLHYRDMDMDGSHGERNMRILQKWLQQEPMNLRIWLYIANQYFAEEKFQAAAHWYTKFWRYRGPNGEEGTPHDKWAAMTYGARALREVGNNADAISSDMAAMLIFPDWADPYIGVGESMFRQGEYEKAIEWLHIAMTKDSTDRVMFMNTLDYTWRIQNILNACYAKTGDFEGAKLSAEFALAVRSGDHELRHNLRMYNHILNAKDEFRKHRKGLTNHPLRTRKVLKNPFTSQLKETRDLVMPALLKKKQLGTQPIVSFFCGRTLQEWYAETPYKEGIGGSETAVVEVTKRLAKKGFKPVVYGTPGSMEGEYDGVLYLNWERWRADEKPEHFVSWRNPRITLDKPQAEHKWFWAHDLNYAGGITEETIGGFDGILPVSDWHGEYLQRLYPFLKEKRFLTMPNGINLERFEEAKKRADRKQPWRMIWPSSPDRGLAVLLDIWHIIKLVEPAAELHVFYGFDNLQKLADSGNAISKSIMESLKPRLDQDGVYLRGKVNQDDLAIEMMQSELWLYPTSFLETFCITAVEAMAADLFCVTSDAGNLPHVIGEAGCCVPGHSATWSFQDKYLDMVTAFMQDMGVRASYRGVGPERAKQFTWDKAVKSWTRLLGK